MGNANCSRVVTIVNPQGMHLRPADLFVKTANRFQAEVFVSKGSDKIEGRSLLSLLTLGAVQGSQLTLHATGPDAAEAVSALADLVAQGFGEMPRDGAAESEVGSGEAR